MAKYEGCQAGFVMESANRLLFRVSLAILIFASLLDAGQAQSLRVSDNKRYLVVSEASTGQNRPFFWLGDTAWELFHRLDLTEADRYLKKRAEQGFTVIQVVLLSELDGLNTPKPWSTIKCSRIISLLLLSQ